MKATPRRSNLYVQTDVIAPAAGQPRSATARRRDEKRPALGGPGVDLVKHRRPVATLPAILDAFDLEDL